MSIDDSEIPIINQESMSFKEQEWKKEHEKILIEWADKGMCYRWLHSRSHQQYSKSNAWFTIPVIIMSTVTGTANFAQEKFPPKYRVLAQMSIGAINIFAGILTTIQQFLKISELNEAHRVSSIAWDKFYRNIKVELAKSRQERMHVGHMLKMCKEEFDRLMETSPVINEKIINIFNKAFPQKQIEVPKDDELEIDEDIFRPEICNELVSTAKSAYRYIEEDEDKNMQLRTLEKMKRHRILMDGFENEVREWCKKFKNKYNRNPLDSEIYDNLQDKIKLEILKKITDKLINEFNNELNNDEKV
jgi:hypothetical protein